MVRSYFGWSYVASAKDVLFSFLGMEAELSSWSFVGINFVYSDIVMGIVLMPYYELKCPECKNNITRKGDYGEVDTQCPECGTKMDIVIHSIPFILKDG